MDSIYPEIYLLIYMIQLFHLAKLNPDEEKNDLALYKAYTRIALTCITILCNFCSSNPFIDHSFPAPAPQ
jgi:hypothetical protein